MYIICICIYIYICMYVCMRCSYNTTIPWHIGFLGLQGFIRFLGSRLRAWRSHPIAGDATLALESAPKPLASSQVLAHAVRV